MADVFPRELETVSLGGSSVNNLADTRFAFGLTSGAANLVSATYTVFGDLVKSQYPEFVPTYPPASQVIDTSYLQAVAKRVGTSGAMVAAAKPTYSTKTGHRTVVSRKSWNIQFNAGKSTFTPEAAQTLDKLRKDLLVAGGTTVEIHGHTDNQGSSATSVPLSEARAFAVKKWLQAKSSANFPESRVRVFAHGEQNPVAPNTTPEGRAKNRRVEIVLSSNGA